MPKAKKKISLNILCRHQLSAPSYPLNIAFRGDGALSLPDSNRCLRRFSWRIHDDAGDAKRRRRKTRAVVSAVLDRDACGQRGLLRASRWSILTCTFRVPSELNDGRS